jgi:integration host factor subunit alpha
MTETITRSYLAESVYKKVGISLTESAEIVDTVFDEIIKAINDSDEVKIAAFGSFYTRSKSKRIGRNPKTKKEAIIEPRKVVSFYASNILKKRINKNND